MLAMLVPDAFQSPQLTGKVPVGSFAAEIRARRSSHLTRQCASRQPMQTHMFGERVLPVLDLPVRPGRGMPFYREII